MRILNIGALALVLVGCGDKDAVDCEADPTNPACPGGTGTGTGTGGDTTPTADVGPSCDEVASFSFGLDYAWDDTAAQTVSFSIDGSASPSLFYIEYGEGGWNGDPNLSTCIKLWDIDGMAKSQTAIDTFAANGFDINPAAGAPIIDTCTEGIVAGNICPEFFDSSNGQAVEGLVYAWTVTAEDPAQDIVDQLSAYFAAGTFWNAALTGDLFPSDSESYSFGFTVDGSFNVTATEADIQQATMQTADGQVNGYYRIINPYIWSFQ